MNALKQEHRKFHLGQLQLPITEEVAVFTHFKEGAMKIQVCQIAPGEIPNHLQLIFTRGAFAWIRLLQGKRLEFRFQKSTMRTHTILNYFGYGQFCIEQSMIIPKTLSYKLNAESLWIRAGMYPVTETASELIVTF